LEIVDEVRRLYFDEGLTHREVAERLGFKSTRPIVHIFREMKWTTRYKKRTLLTRKDVDDENVRKLYFDDGLSMNKVAKKLNTSLNVNRGIFRENRWKSHYDPAKRLVETPDSSLHPLDHMTVGQDKPGLLNAPKDSAGEVYRLYFEEGLSQREVAYRLGFRSDRPIRRIFEENGWQVRISMGGAGKRRRYYESEEQRRLAKNKSRKRTQKRILNLREDLFGTSCHICGTVRKLAIHQKDCTGHDEDALWRISVLKSVDPNEWAALCIPCHRGTHWMMEKHWVGWDELERVLESNRNPNPKVRETLDLPSENIPSSDRYQETKTHFNGTAVELRRTIFGENCYTCGVHYEEKTMVIHRKDGRPPDRKLLAYEKYFRTLNPDEWVSLCRKCHRHITWTMDKLGIEWDDLELMRKM